jgi:hypothetical protein
MNSRIDRPVMMIPSFKVSVVVQVVAVLSATRMPSAFAKVVPRLSNIAKVIAVIVFFIVVLQKVFF